MARFDGRLMLAGRSAVTGGLAWKRQTLAAQVYVDVTGTANDTYYFGKLPKGAIITGGRMYSGRLASGVCVGSSCVELVLGFDQIVKDGSGTSYSIASQTSGLGHFGPINYSTGTSTLGNTNQYYEEGFSAPLGGLLLKFGPLTVQADGNVFGTLVTAAGSGSGVSGWLNLDVDYITGTYS